MTIYANVSELFKTKKSLNINSYKRSQRNDRTIKGKKKDGTMINAENTH